jgi:hypothetical protein
MTSLLTESYDALAAVVSRLRERVALVGTGRAEPTAAERGDLAGLAIPVFS